MSVIYLQSSNGKFLIFCSMDWFRFQKTLAIGPSWIPRYQDFWDKSLGWFLWFQFKVLNIGCSYEWATKPKILYYKQTMWGCHSSCHRLQEPHTVWQNKWQFDVFSSFLKYVTSSRAIGCLDNLCLCLVCSIEAGIC